MNTKGNWFFENLAGLIITVIGLAIIFIGAWQLYSVYANQEEKNAQHLVDSLSAKIELVEEGQVANLVFAGFEAKKYSDWALVGWSKSIEPRPDKCYFKSCICICPDIGLGEKDTYIENCQAKGLCRLFEQERIYLYDLSYQTANSNREVLGPIPESVVESTVDLEKIEGWFEIHSKNLLSETIDAWSLISKNRIEIPNNLMELEIKVGKDELKVVQSNL